MKIRAGESIDGVLELRDPFAWVPDRPLAGGHYTKKVEITDTGMVFASVFRADGSRCGLQSFDGRWYFRTPASIEATAKRAHAWADEYIEMCKRQET